MTPRNVRLVFAKEMRDTLRDRRTLFVAILLPILLYPLLMIGLSQVMMAATGKIKGRSQKVVLVNVSGAAAEAAKQRLLDPEVKVLLQDSEDPGADLTAGEIDAWVDFGEGFAADIEEGRQGGVAVHFDSTKDDSRAAEQKIRRVLRDFGTEVLRQRGLSDADIEPVKVEVADAAPPAQRGAKQFGPMLALLMVVMALSGAFYPAVDIMAGEKERGTMETLLVCPARRTEIVVGKYLTVLTMTLVTALLNFASMGLTFAHFAGMMPSGPAGASMTLTISFTVTFTIVLALIPLAGLFSAVSLALSAFARTYKEGQHYLTPLFVAVMPLTMVALVPGTKLSTFAAVPVAGVVLLVRDLLLETAPLRDVLTVLLTTCAYCALSIWMTVKMFNREEILFRDPGGQQFSLFNRAKKGAGETPQASQALALAALTLVLIFFLMPRFAKMENGSTIAFFVQFIGLFGLLPFVMAKVLQVDIKKTFSLKMPRLDGWIAPLLGAPALLVIMAVVLGEMKVDEESLKPLEEEIRKLTRTIGLPLLILLPPIVEEFFFRGFLLSGLRSKSKPVVAVLIVSVIFAVFHLMPVKYLPTGVIGLWLGYLVIATGSLYPAILAHLVNNALGLVALTEVPPLAAGLLAVPVLAGAIWFAERARRHRPQTAAVEG